MAGLRAGTLYRSEELSRLSDGDGAKLRALGVRLICDLRSPKESREKAARLAPGIRVVNIPLHEQETEDRSRRRFYGFLLGRGGEARFLEFCRWYYDHLAFEQTARIREAITLLAQADHLPALIHCTAGKDRTGLLAALVQLLCGVPYETVRVDYLRTNESLEARVERYRWRMRVMSLFLVTPARMRLMLEARAEFLDQVHERILREHGSVEEYLLTACQVEREALSRLRQRVTTS